MLSFSGRYRLTKLISTGGFGRIYSGEDIGVHQEVAVKIESITSQNPLLPAEAAIYSILNGAPPIPAFHWYGPVGTHSWLVIDRLSATLESLFHDCHLKFSLKTVLMLADQMIASIQYLHAKGFVHRDVKPENFMMGCSPKRGQLFIIDYGLAKPYRDPETSDHIPFARYSETCGTATFASLNALKGFECSRRDDLESVASCLLYFMRGKLPWSDVSAFTMEEKFRRVTELKAEIPVSELCAGLPAEFGRFFQAVRRLEFDEEPQYAVYREWFRDLFVRRQFVFDGCYDWMKEGSQIKPKRWRSSPELNLSQKMGINDWVPAQQTGLRKFKPSDELKLHVHIRKPV
jgi:serine/threonine protein kinase